MPTHSPSPVLCLYTGSAHLVQSHISLAQVEVKSSGYITFWIAIRVAYRGRREKYVPNYWQSKGVISSGWPTRRRGRQACRRGELLSSDYLRIGMIMDVQASCRSTFMKRIDGR